MKTALFILFILTANQAAAQNVFLKEDFQSLENWKPLHFEKIEKHTIYSIEEMDGEKVLKAESNASASGIIFKKNFNIRNYMILRWNWRVEKIF